MLLRRVTEHVKTQNWFAVAIDFVIVVVGVFVGIQVSNWNASRVERAQEQAILVRLVEDYRQLVEREGAYLARSTQRLGLMAQWIDASDKGELRDLNEVRALTIRFYEAEDPALARGLAEATVSDLFTEPIRDEHRPEASITFQQLVASGDLKLIRAEPVRRALASRSARRQDWSTVGLEVLIVVLGVFIGLQVNNWNEARADRQREAGYLQGLAQDVRIDIADMDEIIRVSTLRMSAMSYLLEQAARARLTGTAPPTSVPPRS